jgi:hypothetical protein
MNTITLDKIELNEQILFYKGEGLFIGRIVEVRDKAVKVDYCWESAWSNGSCIVYTYCTWIPVSQITNDKIGGLTVKGWFKKNLNSNRVFHIKKYFIEGGEKVFI